MAESISLHIDGMNELAEQIREITKSMNPDDVEPILLQGATFIADDARRRAPQGPTGNLKRGIYAKTLKRRLSSFAHQEPAPAVATTNYKISPHAHLVEYGTDVRKPKKKKVLYNKKTGQFFGVETAAMPARPYFRPAIDSQWSRVEAHVMQGLGTLIDEAVK